MKKIYKTPTVKTVKIRANAILVGSNVNVYSTGADENEEVLSKDNHIFHGCWEDDEK